MDYTNAQMDRAEGVLLGTAAGDALGAPYEFQPARGLEQEVAMVGGGAFGWEPGEWTDDTSMAIAIAEVAAEHGDLLDDESLVALLQRWHGWMQEAKDVGIQTSTVLRTIGWLGIGVGSAREAAQTLHERTGRTAGNGSLMRTAPVALAYLDDEAGLVDAARAVSELTHFDPEAGDACVLWCMRDPARGPHRRAGRSRSACTTSPEDRRQTWIDRLDAAEKGPAIRLREQRVGGLCSAGCVVGHRHHTVPVEDPASGAFRADHLRLALDAAVRAGNDTDTVAAIAGGLLGAAYGASAVPAEWRLVLHGWPGIISRSRGARRSLVIKARHDDFDPDYTGHRVDELALAIPYDEGVWLGGIGALWSLPEGVDAVVSLCRVGDEDVPHEIPHIEIRLIDSAKPDDNPNLDYVLSDAASVRRPAPAGGTDSPSALRRGLSRTPTVAALYGSRQCGVGIAEALDNVGTALTAANSNPAFRAALRRLDGQQAPEAD